MWTTSLGYSESIQPCKMENGYFDLNNPIHFFYKAENKS